MNRLRGSELCYCSYEKWTSDQADLSMIEVWFSTKYKQTGINWHEPVQNSGAPYSPGVMFYSGEIIKKPDEWGDEGNPAWRLYKVRVERCFDDGVPPFLLPYERWDYNKGCITTIPAGESVLEINRMKYTPWLRLRNHAIYAGTTFRGFLEETRLAKGFKIIKVYDETETPEEVFSYEDC